MWNKGYFEKMRDDRLRKAGEVVVQAQREALGEPGSHLIHSRPGEAPKSQSGRLANSFTYTVLDGRLIVSSSCEYLKYLQGGTSRMPPRDVLAGYEEIKDRVSDICLRGTE